MDEHGLIGKLLGSMIGAAVGGGVAYVAGVKPVAGMVVGAALGRVATAMLIKSGQQEVACTHCGHQVADPEATFCTGCNRALSGLF
jgi:hypothetical protein